MVDLVYICKVSFSLELTATQLSAYTVSHQSLFHPLTTTLHVAAHRIQMYHVCKNYTGFLSRQEILRSLNDTYVQHHLTSSSCTNPRSDRKAWIPLNIPWLSLYNGPEHRSDQRKVFAVTGPTAWSSLPGQNNSENKQRSEVQILKLTFCGLCTLSNG